MNEQEDRIDTRGAVSRRFIACTQSTGRVRKSTVAEGLITWMRYADIDFAAVDADNQPLILSRGIRKIRRYSTRRRQALST